MALDITNGTTSKGVISSGGYDYEPDDYFFEGNVRWGCVCNVAKCVRKCCEKNEIIINRTCVPKPDNKFDLAFYNETRLLPEVNISNYYVVHSRRCPEDYGMFYPDSSEDLFVQEKGSLLVRGLDTFSVDTYCIEDFDGQLFAYLCYSVDNEYEKGSFFNSMGKL